MKSGKNYVITHPCQNPKCPEREHKMEIPENLIIGFVEAHMKGVKDLGEYASNTAGAMEGAQAVCAVSIALKVAGHLLMRAYPFLQDTSEEVLRDAEAHVGHAADTAAASFLSLPKHRQGLN